MVLYCQFLSSFCSSCCQDLASACCTHSLKKTVNPGSLKFFRLIRHFTHKATSFNKYFNKRALLLYIGQFCKSSIFVDSSGFAGFSSHNICPHSVDILWTTLMRAVKKKIISPAIPCFIRFASVNNSGILFTAFTITSVLW